MGGKFHFEFHIPNTVYVLNRSASVRLLAALDGFGDACSESCRRMRDDLRTALAVEDAVETAGEEPEAEQATTVNFEIKSGDAKPEDGAARCAWCGEAGEKLPKNPGDSEPLYVCRTEGCQREGKPAARKFFETGYR